MNTPLRYIQVGTGGWRLRRWADPYGFFAWDGAGAHETFPGVN